MGELISAIEKNQNYRNAKELSIIFNGEPVTQAGKTVYTYLAYDKTEKVDTVGHFCCYYKMQDDNGQSRKVLCTNSVAESFEKAAFSSSLYGIHTNLSFSINDCYIAVDNTLNILFIESGIYHVVRGFAERNYEANSGLTMSVHDVTLTPAATAELVQQFKLASVVNYPKVVFSTKFLNKIGYSNRFYKIQKAFLPVYVKCKYIYNPLDDDKWLKFRLTTLYKESLKHTLDILPDNALSVTMLTQLEVCKVLQMSKFMRFQPSLLYNVLLGMLLPNLSVFPNQNLEVLFNPNATTEKIMDIDKYMTRLNKLNQDKEAEQDEARKMQIEQEIEEMKGYEKQDTLRVFCDLNAKIFSSIGPTILDTDKERGANKFYSYLREARIQFAT